MNCEIYNSYFSCFNLNSNFSSWSKAILIHSRLQRNEKRVQKDLIPGNFPQGCNSMPTQTKGIQSISFSPSSPLREMEVVQISRLEFCPSLINCSFHAFPYIKICYYIPFSRSRPFQCLRPHEPIELFLANSFFPNSVTFPLRNWCELRFDLHPWRQIGISSFSRVAIFMSNV